MKSTLKIYLGLFYLLSEISRQTDSFNCDRCRDANLCDTFTGIFRATQLGRGYHPVVTLPRGACSINVTELADSNNVLALKDATHGDYILNGFWVTDDPGEYDGAGATFYYRQSDASCPGDCLVARGPILSQVLVQLLYHDRNPGIFYTYKLPKHWKSTLGPSHTSDRSELRESEVGQQHLPDSETEEKAERHPVFPPRVPIPGTGGIRHRGPIFSSDFTHRRRIPHGRHTVSGKDNSRRRQALTDVTFSRGESDETFRREDDNLDLETQPVDESRENSMLSVVDEYVWRLTESECSRPCGGGIQESVYVCVNTATVVTVDEINCDNSTKPETQYTVCNSGACTPQWTTVEWSACTVTCGEGTQIREVICKQRISATYTQELDDTYCTSRKPAQQKTCYSEPCYSWVTDDWTDCSVTCGFGSRRRMVQCRDESGTVVDQKSCGQSMPVTEESCDMGACDNDTNWYFSQWNGRCSEGCGTGVVSRSVHCARSTGQVKPDTHCDEMNKPSEEKQCRMDSKCGGKWFSGPWSQCSQSCGMGVKARHVMCMITVGNQMEAGEESNCRVKDKPKEQKNCTEADCGYTWYTTNWSPCSKSCGGGVRTRSVKCYDDKMVPAFMCNESEKPDDSQVCNTARCWTSGQEFFPGCIDRYRNCDRVVQERKCRYPYSRGCCSSCYALHNKLYRRKDSNHSLQNP